MGLPGNLTALGRGAVGGMLAVLAWHACPIAMVRWWCSGVR